MRLLLPHRSWLMILAAVVLGCGGSGPRPVPVPELDQRTLEIGQNSSTAFVGRSPAEVLRAAGEPAQKRPSLGRGSEQWAYAVRAFSPAAGFSVPAAILRIEFDGAGVVTDWYFRDPAGRTRLPVRESLPDAQRFLSSICRQPVPEIDLEAGLQRKQSTQEDVASLLAPVRSDKGREEALSEGLAWEYYVDRPSPVFVPPFYVMVSIENGRVNRIYPSGYGGCA